MKATDLLILGIVFGALLVYYLIKILHSYKLKRQAKGSKRAERAAEKLLQRQGYTIIAAQKRVPIHTIFDGKSYKNHVIADFIVKKDGFRYVVEVKTGKQVEKPTAAGIRRQLLEYYLIYRTDGVLLLDMENQKIHTIEFKLKLPVKVGPCITHTVAIAVGALLVLLVAKGGYIL
ncbi:MAG: hypothetical protein FH758_03580 [Firmicutes bacterium]|nr:hypothetical protein [Bacillota bacterium]